jgi:hypothetical protein
MYENYQHHQDALLSRSFPMISQRKSIRTRRGALTAEWAMTLYVLFFFFALPLLNYGVIGLRAFFLWFACNQACMGGSKAHTLVNPITIGGQTFYGGLSIAYTKALQVKNAFGGISWTASYPQIYIRFVPFPDAAGTSPPSISPVGPLTYVSGTTVSPVNSVPDSSFYLCEFDVSILGTIQPMIQMNAGMFGNNPIPGLTGPITMWVENTAQFENPPGLVK